MRKKMNMKTGLNNMRSDKWQEIRPLRVKAIMKKEKMQTEDRNEKHFWK